MMTVDHDSRVDDAGRIFRIILSVAIVAHAIAALFYALIIADESVRRVVYFVSKLIVNALPAVWIFGIERKRLTIQRPSGHSIFEGVASGTIIAVAILVMYYVILAGRLDATALQGKVGAYGMLDHFFLFAIFLCVFNSGMEEYYWRWFVFGGLKRFIAWRGAVVVSSVGFTLHHIVLLAAYMSDWSLIIVCNVGVFLGGCIWAVQYHRSGQIVSVWVSHLMADAAIMLVAYDMLIGWSAN